MKKIILFFVAILLFGSCATDQHDLITDQNANKILVLKVDDTTNVFEGGKEMTMPNYSQSFDTSNIYKSPSDFGYLQVFYSRTNTKIFDGTIHWMGEGAISTTTDFLPSASFERTNPFGIIPTPAIENIFGPTNPSINYSQIVNQLLNITKVMQYRITNPTAAVKIFLYNPGVGIGNPATWKWIVLFKN